MHRKNKLLFKINWLVNSSIKKSLILSKYKLKRLAFISLFCYITLMIFPGFSFSETISPKILMSTGAIADITWSNNGNTLVFSAGHLEEKGSLASWQAKIYTYSTIWGGINNLTKEMKNCRFPDISPNGKHIVFSAEENDDYSIWRMNINGKNKERLTDNKGKEFRPKWSPDGKNIVYEKRAETIIDKKPMTGSSIWIMKNNGTNKKQVTNSKGYDSYPEWVDNNTLIFHSRSNNLQDNKSKIRILNLKDDTGPQTLVSDNNILGYKLIGQNLIYYKRHGNELNIYQINLKTRKKPLLKNKKSFEMKDLNWAENIRKTKKAYVTQNKGIMELFIETVK